MTTSRRETDSATERRLCCKRVDFSCATPAWQPPSSLLTSLGTTSIRTHTKMARRFLSAGEVRKDPSWTTEINTDDPAQYTYAPLRTSRHPLSLLELAQITGTLKLLCIKGWLVFYLPQICTGSSMNVIYEPQQGQARNSPTFHVTRRYTAVFTVVTPSLSPVNRHQFTS